MNIRALRAALFVLVLSSLHFNQAVAQTNSGTPPVVDVPMLFRGPVPAVEVMVNEQGPFLFAIDTGGAGMARVDSSLVERLKLEKAGQVQGSDGSGRGAVSMDVFELDSVALGGVQFKGVRAASRNYNTSPSLPKIDGILGFNLFAEYLLTLDFPAKRVRLERGELSKADGADVLSFENPRGVPVVELSVGVHKVKAHIDSGNAVGGFILPTTLVEKLELASAPVVVGKARTVSSEVEIKEARLKESIRLGRFEYAGATVVFPALSEDANIGSKVLREFALTFDQKNRRVALKRQETPKASEQTQAPAAQDSKDYPGKYGERTISAEGGALFIQRQGGPRLKMTSVAKDEFALEMVPEARIKFVRDDGGKVVAIDVLNRAGAWEKAAKNQP